MEITNETKRQEEGVSVSHQTQTKTKLELVRKSERLTDQEKLALKKHEETIEKGVKAFWEVGKALIDIQHRKLYKETYLTFDFYLRERWSFGKSQAYRYINAAKTLAVLSPIGDTPALLPENESQIRPLGGLKPSDARVAWNNAITSAGEKPVTATIVEEEVAKLKTPKAEKTNSVPIVDAMPTIVSIGQEHDLAFMNMDAALKDLKKIKKLHHTQQKDWAKLLNDIVAALETLGVTME